MGWVAGSPREILAQLRALADAGIDLAILGHYDLSDEQAMQLIAEEVMPELG
jgi:alkanesulfonate monooxygenase SsuD/methylene tetrahydromethanopterin reductase-like flavin-dependent oxidoreductase (luciferase family)